jgi:YegS/Rv2252/BmrU family lipid kinase
MAVRKAILISNPKTGRYAARRPAQLDSLGKYLRTHGVEVDMITTKGPGDATSIAAQAATDGFSEVIVAGGDGTINEALQGLVGTKVRLGILPRGTGNVLARELALPLNLKGATEVIARGRTRKVHLGCAMDETSGERRYFFLMAGIGLDAEVVSRVPPGLKKRLGRAALWYTGFARLADWNPVPFDVQINDETYSATFVTIGKAARYGSDLCVTPRARIDEPEFQICLVDSQSRLRYLRLLSQAMRGGMRDDTGGIRFLHATRARGVGQAAVQVDGELIGKLPMSFEIAPESIEVIA